MLFKTSTKTKTTTEVAEKMSRGEWMQKYWRPCAAFMYMICCLADFAIFPIMFTVVQFWETQAANDAFRQWVPITLQGGGLFHVSMCAVLGVSAYGRTQEKLAGQSAAPAGLPSPTLTPTGGNNGNFSNPSTGFDSQPAAPSAGGFGSTPSPAGFSAPATSGFGGSSFGSAPATAAPSFGGDFGGSPTALATTASGKKIVPDQPQPLL